MCKSSAGPGRNNTIWKLSVSALCQPATRYTPHPPLLLKNIPSGAPMAASFSDSPPLTPSGQETVVQPRSQRAQGPRFLSFFPPPDSKMALLAARSGLGKEGGETQGESSEERERRRESAEVCIFNLIAPSLHFAPRFKKPTYSSSSSSGLFSNMTRISPELMFSRWQDGSHEPCSRQPCVLTVDFESELRSILFVCLF